MNAISEICVPDIGDFQDVPVIEVLVKVGDVVNKEDSLLILESDKATMDVPSPLTGLVREVRIKVGDCASEGTPVMLLEVDQADKSAVEPESMTISSAAEPTLPAAAAVATPGPAVVTPTRASPDLHGATASQRKPHASPALRRQARELGVDLSRVTPSGKNGRIVRDDLIRFVKETLARGMAPGAAAPSDGLDLLPWPSIDFSKFGRVESVPLSRIKKVSGANLSRNWVRIPHVTNFDEADITDLEEFRLTLNREARGEDVKLTMLAFLIKAAAATLKVHPQFNASLDHGDGAPALIIKHYYNVGFAADTPGGLVVPVIRNADLKGIREIAMECAELARKAREGKLTPAELSGGCFTVSSLGGIGGTGFTPIINAPEVAILGVTRSSIKPIWDGSVFVPRLILPMCLSWDHRVVDGAAAARFLVHLASLLTDFRRVML